MIMIIMIKNIAFSTSVGVKRESSQQANDMGNHSEGGIPECPEQDPEKQ